MSNSSLALTEIDGFFPVEQRRIFIVRKVTKFPNGQRRKRPVWQRGDKLYRSLKDAKALKGGRTVY